MPTPTRELTINYGGYNVDTLVDFYVNTDGPDVSLLKFSFEIGDPDPTAFASKVDAARTAFRTPRKGCTVTCRGKVLESFSHTSGTGFNSKPEITKDQPGSSANSRFFSVEITFGRPADVHGTSYRRNSTVKVMWTTDRRAHVEVDGVYTCNGSTTARQQYLDAIGTYASAILSALGGTYDLLEENVVNDDQNKVATFHRKYDQQIDGRNNAEIVIETLPNTRKRVTISGMYSTIEAASSSFAAYTANYPAFRDAVLGAIGGTFQETTGRAEKNDTDLVTTFTNVYDEMKDGRQDGSFQIIYALDRRISVFFYATYFTGITGVDAFALAKTDFPTWALGILGTIGGTFNKKSESYQPNDVVPPNYCPARLEFLEAYTSQAGALPHPSIRDQNYKVTPTTEAPGDSPGVGVQRMIEIMVDYVAEVDHTVSTNLVGIWAAIQNWIVGTVVAQYKTGSVAVMQISPSYNPDNNIISARMKMWIAPSAILLYKIEITDSVDQGKVFDGLWTGNIMNFHVYDGHAIALRRVTKTYRRTIGGAAPGPAMPIDIHSSEGNLFSEAGAGEGNQDPFSFGSMQMHIVHREQPRTIQTTLGYAPNQITVEDITFTVVMRIVEAVSGTS